ncbi:MAG TPA: hypothetical protein VFR97_05000 [Capillimicrobium sp.]|nr:hypothetical protein [Capillimicrobium sp.]
MTRHPLGRVDLIVYALAFVLGIQLYLLARVLDANALARRRWRDERAYADNLRDRLEMHEDAPVVGQVIAVERVFHAPEEGAAEEHGPAVLKLPPAGEP